MSFHGGPFWDHALYVELGYKWMVTNAWSSAKTGIHGSDFFGKVWRWQTIVLFRWVVDYEVSQKQHTS
jgi:hypothetical protein